MILLRISIFHVGKRNFFSVEQKYKTVFKKNKQNNMVNICVYSCPFCQNNFGDICNKHPDFDNNGSIKVLPTSVLDALKRITPINEDIPSPMDSS